MKVYLKTYGCAANQAHSEIMKGLLTRAGCNIVENEKLADILIINSCIVKNPTENKIIHQIKKWKENYPEKNLIIAGCMPQAEYNRTKKFAPDSSLVGPNNCNDIVKAVQKTSQGKQVEYLEKKREAKLCLPRIRQNKLIDICEISQGCLGNCTYCQVKFAKGNLKSYPPNDILKEIKQSLNTGCKEVWITSQDNAAYGRDLGTTVTELLKRITKLSGNFRVRVGMMNPKTAKPIIMGDLPKVLQNEKIYSFLHLPIQSGSKDILKKMNRNYSPKEFKKMVEEVRNKIPKLNLWTDVIVGFPGETEENFRKTKEVVKKLKPEFVNISRFGARPGTEAKDMENKISSETKKNRSKKISKVVHNISSKIKENLIGKEREILITEKGKNKNQWKGRDNCYRQVVVNSNKDLRGKFEKVKINDFTETHMVGEKVS